MLGKLFNGELQRADGKILVYEGVVVANPREEDYRKAGYKDIKDNPLEEREGYIQVAEYTETEDKIIINYHYEEATDDVE
jgi:hypothetical protein